MLSLTSELAGALRERRPVVALESTVIAHGLPAPENLATALACEAAVREGGARPATMAIIDGRPSIGLDEAQLRELAGRKDVAKVNPANMAEVISRGGWGATTVAASLHLAERAGIRVFATGGIGGVHRGAERSFDISADLLALSRYKVVTVCAGAKAILDLPRTREVLETLGVPVIGYRTDELPAFYSRTSGLPVDRRVEAAAEVVEIARAHWELGLATGILVVVPVPVEDEIPAEELAAVIDEALAAGADLSGKAVTPFLLQRVARQTAGRSLRANMALLRNNARVAGEIAAAGL
ncbi:MAG: pseudouridine-5'-phosphate glycosidase [Acidobacteriota bacterium]|jgi:pseudouridine-5'-phosphate glycosidase